MCRLSLIFKFFLQLAECLWKYFSTSGSDIFTLIFCLGVLSPCLTTSIIQRSSSWWVLGTEFIVVCVEHVSSSPTKEFDPETDVWSFTNISGISLKGIAPSRKVAADWNDAWPKCSDLLLSWLLSDESGSPCNKARENYSWQNSIHSYHKHMILGSLSHFLELLALPPYQLSSFPEGTWSACLLSWPSLHFNYALRLVRF